MLKKTMQVGVVGIAGCVAVALVSGDLVAQDSAPPPRQSPPKLPDNDVTKGYLAAPPGTESLSVELGEHSIQLFANPNYQGSESTLNKLDTIQAQGRGNQMPQDLNDKISSLRWHLPPGGIVVFYDDADLEGKQLVLWGKGQISDLGRWDFNDKASRWSWYNVGGAGTPLRGDASTMLPIGAETLGVSLSDNTMNLFKDKSFGNDMKQVSPVTAVKAGELHPMPDGLDDNVASAQWLLPPGVIVLLHEHPDGKGDRVAIWGGGQMSDLGAWRFNDKGSRWSWAYIGQPAKGR